MSASNRRGRKPQSTSGASKSLIVMLCVLLAIVILILTIFVVIPAVKGNRSGGALADFFDPNAQSGSLPGKTPEEIQAELDRIVEEGMFNISIASIVAVENGDRALVRIENIAANHHNMTVTITLDEGNETVYESAGLAPGQYIEYATLNRKIAAGEYSATALFTAYDTGDLTRVGQAAAKITIVVGS